MTDFLCKFSHRRHLCELCLNSAIQNVGFYFILFYFTEQHLKWITDDISSVTVITSDATG